jgi:hypothetical protein
MRRGTLHLGMVIACAPFWTAAQLSAVNPALIPQMQSAFPLSLPRAETSEFVVRGSSLESATGVLFDCADIEFLLDTGVHAIAWLRDLLGEVAEVFAQTLGHNPALGGPEGVLMQLRLRNGCSGQFFACYNAKLQRESALDVTVYGSQGTLEITLGRASWSHGQTGRAACAASRNPIGATKGSGATSPMPSTDASLCYRLPRKLIAICC